MTPCDTVSAMCAQCMMGAMSVATGATGLRAWLMARSPAWLTPARRKHVSRALIALGVLACGLVGPSAA